MTRRLAAVVVTVTLMTIVAAAPAADAHVRGYGTEPWIKVPASR